MLSYARLGVALLDAMPERPRFPRKACVIGYLNNKKGSIRFWGGAHTKYTVVEKRVYVCVRPCLSPGRGGSQALDMYYCEYRKGAIILFGVGDSPYECSQGYTLSVGVYDASVRGWQKLGQGSIYRWKHIRIISGSSSGQKQKLGMVTCYRNKAARDVGRTSKRSA